MSDAGDTLHEIAATLDNDKHVRFLTDLAGILAGRRTPENIAALRPGEFFVFGSNLAGRHGSGAAAVARIVFGAEYGIGEGLTGRCYAFPTLDHNLADRAIRDLEHSRDLLFATARALPDKTFLLTKVGCGLAGYPEETMSGLFRVSPQNIIKPAGW